MHSRRMAYALPLRVGVDTGGGKTAVATTKGGHWRAGINSPQLAASASRAAQATSPAELFGSTGENTGNAHARRPPFEAGQRRAVDDKLVRIFVKRGDRLQALRKRQQISTCARTAANHSRGAAAAGVARTSHVAAVPQLSLRVGAKIPAAARQEKNGLLSGGAPAANSRGSICRPV